MTNRRKAAPYQWTKADEAISETLQEYVGNFVKHGDPNGMNDLPRWPKWDTGNVLQLGETTCNENLSGNQRMNFLKNYRFAENK